MKTGIQENAERQVIMSKIRFQDCPKKFGRGSASSRWRLSTTSYKTSSSYLTMLSSDRHCIKPSIMDDKFIRQLMSNGIYLHHSVGEMRNIDNPAETNESSIQSTHGKVSVCYNSLNKSEAEKYFIFFPSTHHLANCFTSSRK
ncbi:hypothetical protein E2C01_021336 [Portunus trituberculatus]|uniref:Uncharacterized protein n=1 Tax=Portunus trituberculatus TaxID=210409 RepID=A0A5B7E286_PORTR|nr:hypothetical protein [Portunus trituberculatus]